MVFLFDGNDCVKQKHKSCESSKPVFSNDENMFIQLICLLMCFGQVFLMISLLVEEIRSETEEQALH
jgi:hypothetical protein